MNSMSATKIQNSGVVFSRHVICRTRLRDPR
jgi:hypothetical protein